MRIMKKLTYQKRFVEYYDLFKGSDFKRDIHKLHPLLRGCKTVLDVGCGTGKHAQILKKLGYAVEGIDYSPEMIRYAKKGVKGIKFHIGDAATFKLKKKFDCIIALDSVLSFLRENKFDQAIRNITRHLKKSGKVIFDIAFTDKLVGKPFESGIQQTVKKGDVQLTRLGKMKRVGNFLKTDIELTGTDKGENIHITETHNHTILKTKHIMQLLRKLGYKVEIAGNYSTKKSWHNLQVTATKQ